ncbi:MAG: ABC transporter ATP-binding protein, partial [Deltaproteobacteria bacterium]|nr:ABC transporter ATP-binding protein [Deltaproteobacteria bacterium]
NFTYKEKYELENIEEKILEKEEMVEKFTNKIQDPEIINNPEKMKLFCSKLEQSQEDVNTLYERWEFLENKKQGGD